MHVASCVFSRNRPCASCGGIVYVLVAPFEACIPACAPVLEFSMKLLVWSKTAGKGIAAGTEITFC